MRNKTSIGLVLSAAIAAASWGCGAGPATTKGGESGSAGSNNGGSSGNSGSSGDSGSSGVGGFAGTSGAAGSGQAGTAGMACAGSSVKGELIPLDMYIMLDKSGSMLDKTGQNGNGPPKWDAVTAALDAFFADQGSDGLGVGIQFFPMNLPGVPDSCTNNNQCGAGGPCILKACTGMSPLTPCNSNADCGFLGQCATLGQCQNNPTYYCFTQGQTCGTDM